MNKKIILLLAIVLTMSLNVFAQDTDAAEVTEAELEASEVKIFSIGLGPEWNMNSAENFAAGLGLSFDYQLQNALAIGFTIGASNNFNETTTLEFGALLRFYLLGTGHKGFFTQFDIGASIILEEDDMTPVFMGGIRTGHRLNMGSGYFEPSFRIGYPFAFGVGALFGMHIEAKAMSPEEKEALRAARIEAAEARRIEREEAAEARRLEREAARNAGRNADADSEEEIESDQE